MNESLVVTEFVELNGRGYLFLIPFGAPYADVYEVLALLDKENRAKQTASQEAEEKKKLETEVKNSLTQAAL